MNYNIDEIVKNLPSIRLEDVLPVFQCPYCFEDMTKIGKIRRDLSYTHLMSFSCNCGVWVFHITAKDMDELISLQVKDIFNQKYWWYGRKCYTKDEYGIVRKIDYTLADSEKVPTHYYKAKE